MRDKHCDMIKEKYRSPIYVNEVESIRVDSNWQGKEKKGRG